MSGNHSRRRPLLLCFWPKRDSVFFQNRGRMCCTVSGIQSRLTQRFEQQKLCAAAHSDTTMGVLPRGYDHSSPFVSLISIVAVPSVPPTHSKKPTPLQLCCLKQLGPDTLGRGHHPSWLPGSPRHRSFPRPLFGCQSRGFAMGFERLAQRCAAKHRRDARVDWPWRGALYFQFTVKVNEL